MVPLYLGFLVEANAHPVFVSLGLLVIPKRKFFHESFHKPQLQKTWETSNHECESAEIINRLRIPRSPDNGIIKITIKPPS